MKKYFYTPLLLLSLLAFNACGDDQKDSSDQSAGAGRPGGGKGGGEQQQRAVSVDTMTIEPQTIEQTQQLPARVKAFRIAEIRPQVSGIIESRLFEEGSLVTKGQQLYQIDDARYEADYQMALANLETAQAQNKSAQALSNRYERLVKKNAISKQQYDDAVASAAQAKAAISQAKASVDVAKINLEYTKVFAPIDGYIGTSMATEGALVTAQQQMELATIRQMDPVYVDMSQSSSQMGNLQTRLMNDRMNNDRKQEYEVTLLINDSDTPYPIKGKLDATDLSVSEETGAIRLRAQFPNPNAVLLPGMFVSAVIADTGQTKSIIVPQKAVKIEPDGEKSIWVVNADNKATKRTIVTGTSYKNNWVVKDGLQQGDVIITDGTMMLQEGAKVDTGKDTDPTNNNKGKPE